MYDIWMILLLFTMTKNIYLNVCKKIILKLENTFKLQVNLKKPHITNNKEGFVFLGYKFKVVNKKNIVVIRQETFKKIKKKLKEVNYLYDMAIYRWKDILTR